MISAWRLIARMGLQRCLALFVAGMALAGCQSAGTEDVLTVQPEPVPAEETLGSGPVLIAMLLPRSAPEHQDRARDVVAGARLAVEELGAGQVRIVVHDTAAPSQEVGALAERSIEAGARLIVGDFDAAGAARIAAIKPAARPPVISLSHPGAAGIYAFTSDSLDSAVDGARAAIEAGQSGILALVPEGFPAADRERFAAGVKRHKGKLVGVIAYPPADAMVGPALKAEEEKFLQANAVAIFGSGRAPAVVAQAIAAQGLGGTITTLIGNSGWPSEVYAEPVLEGALVALADQDSLKQIADRYQAAAGRPLSLDAALAYDAVAIAAGLVRARGAAGLSNEALTSDAGFRGATGMFRFRKDGSVERRHAIYRIEQGKLVLLQGGAAGF